MIRRSLIKAFLPIAIIAGVVFVFNIWVQRPQHPNSHTESKTEPVSFVSSPPLTTQFTNQVQKNNKLSEPQTVLDPETRQAQSEGSFTHSDLPTPPPGLPAFPISGSGTNELLLDAYRAWGKEAGQDAIDYALLKGPMGSHLRLEAARAAFLGWAEVAPFVAADYVASIMIPGQDYLVFSAPYVLVTADSQRAIDWAFNHVPAELQRGTAQHTMLALLDSAPASAYDWASQIATEKQSLSFAERTAFEEVMIDLARRDLDQAVSFVESIPGTNAWSTGAKTLLPFLNQNSPAKLKAWIGFFSNKEDILPETLDPVIAEGIQILGHDDYESAQELLTQIRTREVYQSTKDALTQLRSNRRNSPF